MQFKHVCLEQNHMATTFSLLLSVPAKDVTRADRTLEEAHALIHKIELELTEFKDESPVAKFNAASEGVSIEAPDSLLEILRLSCAIEKQTDSAFSCFVKSKAPLKFSEAIAIDWKAKKITKLKGSAHLSFGAIGKGYALDQVRTLVEREGFRDFILNAGGSSILISGFSAPNQPWDWAWSWKKDSEGIYQGQEFFHHSGYPTALGISGTMEQGLHILDPKTGEAREPMASALVAHNSAAYADALSTALYIRGWDEVYPNLEGPITSPAIAIIDHEERPCWNQIFAEYWGAIRSVAVYAFVSTFLFLNNINFALANDDEVIDLSDLGVDTFNPYLYERNSLWILLPLLILLAVLVHLPFPFRRKNRVKRSSGGR